MRSALLAPLQISKAAEMGQEAWKRAEKRRGTGAVAYVSTSTQNTTRRSRSVEPWRVIAAEVRLLI